MKQLQALRVAFVYDRVNTFGGAERVLQNLHELFPEAPLYTSVYDAEGAPWTKGWIVIPSFLQKLPRWLRVRHQLLGLCMPLAFEFFDFSSFNLVISVTSEAAKGIITKPGTKHICYLLTPTRYLWNKAQEYEHDFYSGWKKLFLLFHRCAVQYLRWWDRIAAQRPDVIIPISAVVQRRCKEYYHRVAAPVIYPPTNVKTFQPTVQTKPLAFSSFYLCVARFVPYKRLDLAIRACKILGRNLVLVGAGQDESRLRALAGNSPQVAFVGHLTEDELVRYYQQCTGLLFPGEEDFGLTVVEAMAAGKPAVVYAKSGNAEVILPGITGVVVEQQREDALIEAMQQVERMHWDSERIRRHAMQYDVSRWKAQWRSVV